MSSGRAEKIQMSDLFNVLCIHDKNTTLAVLNIVPPEQKNCDSIADDPINLAHLLGMLHIVDLIC
jgi:hypothetical protein